ncbi:MAG: ATP-grasp domain-containing protein [Micavibrio aeruginosavorus]|uniref:ATP-grasp domain-containing protein n=1 Tax=Micavibrio aeruginosavorus TaxID=349221 RepID=A0A7T5R2N2_9BACT|nr:MAG: ATP-grasp domain-containing protein [Micavibrio aeruginosavorus]
MKPPEKPCIAIIHSDIGKHPTPDDADTLIQAQFIQESLQNCGYHAPLLPFRPQSLPEKLNEAGAAGVFNLVEAVGGEDERSWEAAAFFERQSIPYSGNSARALRELLNKPTVKRRLQQAGLPTPAFAEDGSQEKEWILKSETFHCSRGIDKRNVSKDLDSLRRLARECAARYSGAWFIEEYIPGREINVALLDNGTMVPDVLPASEICFTGQEPHIVDYDSKWVENSESYKNTTPSMLFQESDHALLQELARLSRQCWQLFSLRGYARVDFRISRDGRPYILEINANPCLSPDAGFMRAVLHSEQAPHDVVRQLIEPLLHSAPVSHGKITA